MHILWREYGATRISTTATGFGQMVLQRLTAEALNGRTTWSNQPNGTMWEFVCPMENAGQLG